VAEQAVEVTEKESTREPVEVIENEVAVTEGQEVEAATGTEKLHVESHVWWLTLHPGAKATSEETFTREANEDALDKVSRPVKGKYADVPYSSEDLIREKRTETQLEDR
jgi:hypothetical protein